MQIKARAKINWALNVLSKRPDGYHDLDMLNQRLRLADDVLLAPAQDIALTVTGSGTVPAGPDNLAWQAASLMQALHPRSVGVQIALDKRIPSGAGLGGGSADAAAVMLGLNKLWGLNMSLIELRILGASLGADLPYCLAGGFARVGGTGDVIAPVWGAAELPLVLIQPRETLSTKRVFQHFGTCMPGVPADIPGTIWALRQNRLDSLPLYARNQLQPAAISLCPAIQDAIDALYAHQAVFAQMSGAGSLVYGVYQDIQAALKAEEALSKKWDTCLMTQTVPH